MEEQQEIVDCLMRTERLANVIGQSPKYIRDDIGSLVEREQIPGSFGELIKHSFGITEEHKKFDGTNIVSMIGRRTSI